MLLFFTITARRSVFVYLYVVPQLSSSLTAERLERLETAGAEERAGFERAASRPQTGASSRGWRAGGSDLADARVTLLGRPRRRARVRARRLAVGFRRRPQATIRRPAPRSPTARSAAAVTGSRQRPARPRSRSRTAARSVWVAVYSTPLAEVEANVSLIRRQIIIAGGIALLAALLAAWLAAGAHARRLRRLEQAAEEVADGNFSVPIPIDSRDEVGQLASSFDEMQATPGAARLGPPRVHRQRLARAADADRLARRLPRAARGRGPRPRLAGGVPADDARTRSTRLEKLTTDLLDLSRIDADALALSTEPVDLIEIASEVAAEFAAVASRADATLEIGDAEGGKPLAQADRTRTMQIMRILIDNAIKHTPPGTTIAISTHTDPGTASVSVADDGPGIPAEQHARVFDRFHTADPGGSGLGLAISRELARLMGGELRLVSPAPGSGRGSVFTLSLPAAPAAAEIA